MTEEKERKPRLFLVDASGYIFRAFYALPPMTDPEKTPVGAVYGFTKMLMDMVEKNRASHIGIVFDAARRNWRHDLYAQYKANRQETPPELVPQFPLIREVVKAFDLKGLEKEGYEADDLIASYADKAVKLGMEVVIMSADKDLMQLKRQGVTLYDPMKNREITDEVIKEKFGVAADKVIDVQALAGDSSDNIPGVEGIGPKTAAELINTYGSVEDVIANADDIKQPKRREMIKRDAEKAIISKQLATLKTDAPTVDMNELKSKCCDMEKVRPFLERHAFKSLVGRLAGFAQERNHSVTQSEKARTIHDPTYAVIQSFSDFEKWINRAKDKGILAIDTETTSLDTSYARMVGFSIAVEEGEGAYVPIGHNSLMNVKYRNIEGAEKEKIFGLLKETLSDESVLKVGHNIKYDMHIFKNTFGESQVIRPIADTMVQSYVLDGRKHGHGMDELAMLFFGMKTVTYEEICGKGVKEISFSDVQIDTAAKYAAEDADVTMRMYNLLSKRMTEEKMTSVYEKIERPLITVLLEMERAGVLLDTELLKSLSGRFEKEMDRLEKEIHVLAGEEFNVQSPMQVGRILFEKFKYEGGTKTKIGNYRVDVDVLENLADQGIELASKILEHRTLAKLKGTYTDSLSSLMDKNGRVHTVFSQTVTSTGRLASSNPNLQNIPIKTELGREIRKAFIAGEGNIILSADYSQIELRLLSDMADIDPLKEAFEKGIDIHKQTASKVFRVPLSDVTAEQRRRAKIINFSIVYGISGFGLSGQLGVSVEEANTLIKTYLSEFSGIKAFMDRTITFAKANGYVETYFGRKCFVPTINDRIYAKRQYAERAAVNAPIQGTNADLIKMAMNRIKTQIDAKELKARMLLQVHDELVFEVKETEKDRASKIIKETMENVHTFKIPLIVEVGSGKNWNEAH